MTINGAVSLLRETIKEHADSTDYSSEYLWQLFSSALSSVREERLRRYGFNNPNYYHTFCIEMRKGLSHECPCIEVGCNAFISVHPLPEYLTTTNNNTLSVFTLSNKRIDEIPNFDLYDAYKYDEGYKNKSLFYLQNNKIIMPDCDSPKVIQVKAIWRDLLDWSTIQYCSDDTGGNCDIYNTNIGIEPGTEFDILKKIFAVLNIPLNLREDKIPDNNNDVR